MKKLILRCGLSPGDIVMLTAAVRDLHRWYPGKFLTDVRTRCPDLWENNPNLTALAEDDPEVEEIDCVYPLIHQSNRAPYHCLHGFIEFFNQRLRLNLKPTLFKGDIHLSPKEKSWRSQIYEIIGQNIPFWIMAAGGKYDLTIKWWQSSRYQEVVDHFRGRIQFVQVGHSGHHHPKLDGAIDLRGQTSLRELIRLVYHSQGALCSVTALMHLTAAVEAKPGQPPNRPCVVIAGGREAPNWEAYPHHQYIHTVGALRCCAKGGCWRDRTVRLRDGDKRDRTENLCLDVVNGLPHCMALIQADEVIRRIETYFHGGAIKFLSARQKQAAEQGVLATARNTFDQQPLTLSSVGLACEQFIKAIPAYPDRYSGRGIVICGGGVRYFTNAWVCIHMLRRLGCTLPVQLWHLGNKEMDSRMKALVRPLAVECVDALKVAKTHPVRALNGWELKAFAMLQSSFREIMLLDADNVPVVNPEFLFDTPQYQATGAIFWPDYWHGKDTKAMALWRSLGMQMPDKLEFESGQIVVNKKRCWNALSLSLWMNENSDFFYKHVYGDKETFHLAFRKLKAPYSLISKPIHPLKGVMCQHDFQGRRILQHRNTAKWDLFFNKRIKGFKFEKECREDIANLRRLWDGRTNSRVHWKALDAAKSIRRATKIEAVMITCRERNAMRRQTLANLAQTDWGSHSLQIHFDNPDSGTPQERLVQSAHSALKKSLDLRADYILFLEDDVDFNKHLRHNLCQWAPVKARTVTVAGLYNPQLREKDCDINNNARVVEPHSIYGGQALLLSKDAIEYVLRNWDDVPGLHDLKIPRLAGRLRNPIYYHAPSLVQHIGVHSTWGGGFHQASDFDSSWKA